jgi:DUF1680 family protein
MDMMGCCVPEGMRAIHTAWANTVRKEADGIHVNMCFNRDAPEARVICPRPNHGRMTVRAKAEGDFYVRPPAWAPRDEVTASRNGKTVELVWCDGYVFFERTAPDDELVIAYPMVSFVQKQTVKNAPGEPDRVVTVTWLGNTVTKLEPKGEKLPLYQQVPRVLPPLPE